MTVASKVKQTLYSLKGAQSTLRVYSLQCQNKSEKDVYKEALNINNEVIEALQKRIKVIEFQEPQYKDK